VRLLICGDRHWDDYALIKKEIQDFNDNVDTIEAIIQGGAKGADFCGKLAAIELGIPYEEFLADWDRQGKRAGPLRNQRMLEEGKPDYVLAFHDDFENSKGTKSMVNIASKAGVMFNIIHHDTEWNPTGTVHPLPAPTSPVGRPLITASTWSQPRIYTREGD
jgi:hypothetical protein